MDYKNAEKQIKIITNNSSNVLEDIVTFLYDNFEHYSWVGIYIVKGNDLILGPWRGPNATEHTKIPIGKGVCGSAAATGKTEVVDDVHSDKRYLSCFVSTKSEIVVPIKKEGMIVGEIDIDSDAVGTFTIKDKIFLEKIADMLSAYLILFFQHSRSSSQTIKVSERVRSSLKKNNEKGLFNVFYPIIFQIVFFQISLKSLIF